ncbi:MAG: hypothetical protein C0480_12875 [Bradyrhizobium sp.]|nr:hypothetical protein [Bradyrhizobium sp.]
MSSNGSTNGTLMRTWRTPAAALGIVTRLTMLVIALMPAPCSRTGRAVNRLAILPGFAACLAEPGLVEGKGYLTRAEPPRLRFGCRQHSAKSAPEGTAGAQRGVYVRFGDIGPV